SLGRARRGARPAGRPRSEFAFEMESLLRIDPALFACEETGRFEVGLDDPRALDADETGAVWIAGDRELRAFREGRLERRIELEGEPTCVEPSPGALYVGFRDRVEVWDAALPERKARWESLGPKARIVSVAAGASGVYAADAGGRVVLRYDRSGKVLGRLGERDPERGVPGLIVPSPHLDLALGRDGLLRVANTGRHRIEAYTPDGHLEVAWGESSNALEGFSGCCNPCAFAILPDGSFVTAEKGIPRVKLYDARGAFAGAVAGPESFAEGRRALREEWPSSADRALDVAVDAEGRVLVLDPSARAVIRFERREGRPKSG
ncbi:MAG: hypothetical protein ACUVYA_18815, partial [Planctomycetota bacterium]